MKKRTVQIMSIGLSAISLAGAASQTAIAQEIDPAEENLDQAETVVETDVETALDAETIADEACDAMQDAQESTQDAASETHAAVITLETEEIQEDDAQALVENASNSVEIASEELENAEEKYNQLVSEYENAKLEYENAVLAYATKIQDTQDSLQEAESGLTAVETRLHQLEQQIEDARERVYEYTDADGQIVQVSEEEAEALNGQKEIDNYWTIDGTYVPRYVEYMRYSGTRNVISYNSRSAIQSGKQYVKNAYRENDDYYKTTIEYNNDWSSDREAVSVNYETTGTFTAFYNKASEKDGYAVSDTVKEEHFTSEEEAVGAVIKEARKLHGAETIDPQESKLTPTNVTLYSDIVETYIYLGGDEVAYKKLIADAEEAKANLQAAQEKVQTIQEKLANLKDDDSLLAMVQVTYLETRLDAATASYNQAKDNLNEANINLKNAKNLYATKYIQKASPESDPIEQEDDSVSEIADETSSQSLTPNVKEIEKTDADKELEDEKNKEKQELLALEAEKQTSDESDSDYSYSDGSVISFPKLSEIKETIQEDKEEIMDLLPFLNGYEDTAGNGDNRASSSSGGSSVVPQNDVGTDETILSSEPTITIPDGATPKDITLTGLKQHRKWFVALGGIAAAGVAGVGIFEAKRRAIAKILDKMNQ